MSPQVIGTARSERVGHLQRPGGVAMSNAADEINDRSDAEPSTARAAGLRARNDGPFVVSQTEEPKPERRRGLWSNGWR